MPAQWPMPSPTLTTVTPMATSNTDAWRTISRPKPATRTAALSRSIEDGLCRPDARVVAATATVRAIAPGNCTSPATVSDRPSP